MTNTDLLHAVEEVARLAGNTAMRRYDERVTVERKADGSEVSIADREAELSAREWIAARFPRDGILGEELPAVNPGARRRWILDPIDGTTSFVRRVPLWGTLVAVAEGESVIAGAIYCPVVNELACAALGEGCWWNGQRAQVSPVSTLGESTVLSSAVRFPKGQETKEAGWLALAQRARAARTWGDCYGYLLVATGRAEVMADPVMSIWDSAALQPVITEAGGVFTDWSGRDTGFGGNAIATNAAVSREARAILGAG